MVQSKLPLHQDDLAPPPVENRHARDKVEWLLQQAGIALNGGQPWDMRVLNEHLYERILSQGYPRRNT